MCQNVGRYYISQNILGLIGVSGKLAVQLGTHTPMNAHTHAAPEMLTYIYMYIDACTFHTGVFYLDIKLLDRIYSVRFKTPAERMF